MMQDQGRPAVLDETAADESFLLGTRQQLSLFAHEILRLLDEPSRSSNWHGVNVDQPAAVHALSDPMAEVVIDGLVIVDSESDRRKLMDAIRVNCGDPSIDWAGYDRLPE